MSEIEIERLNNYLSHKIIDIEDMLNVVRMYANGDKESPVLPQGEAKSKMKKLEAEFISLQ